MSPSSARLPPPIYLSPHTPSYLQPLNKSSTNSFTTVLHSASTHTSPSTPSSVSQPVPLANLLSIFCPFYLNLHLLQPTGLPTLCPTSVSHCNALMHSLSVTALLSRSSITSLNIHFLLITLHLYQSNNDNILMFEHLLFVCFSAHDEPLTLNVLSIMYYNK